MKKFNKTAVETEAAVVAETENQGTAKPETKASVCRKLFVDGLSRKEISVKLGIRYQQVYQYTSAMTNAHHNDQSTGRAIIMTTDSGEKVTRKEYVIQELRNGRTRGAVAKELGVPYQVVYGYLKKEGLLNLGIPEPKKTEIESEKTAEIESAEFRAQ